MKFAACLLLIGSSAFAATAPFSMDPNGPVRFTSSSVDCQAGTITVQRRFRNETHRIHADLCSDVATNKRQYDQLGYDASGDVVAVGFAAQDHEEFVVSTN